MHRRFDSALILEPDEAAKVAEALQDAYAECDLCEDISQRAVDKLERAIAIMDEANARARHHNHS